MVTSIDPTAAVLTSAGGDFFLTLFGVMFLFVLGLCTYLVYRMPKEWEASTDRIVSKLCDIMSKEEELLKCYGDHDKQAKEIKDDTKDVKKSIEVIERKIMQL